MMCKEVVVACFNVPFEHMHEGLSWNKRDFGVFSLQT